MSNQTNNNTSNLTTSYSTNSTEISSIYSACTENLTPWTTILTLTLLYFIAILWFCKHGKNVCHPTPDSIFPYIERLRFLRRALDDFLVDDINIELTDIKLGQGAVGFVFKGYVVAKSQTRFRQKVFAAVKVIIKNNFK
uniref:Uncharacterized protein n=1 Tax=Meloidogyne incognita TaxID=6306 RepID=A0A914M8E4_MELIC